MIGIQCAWDDAEKTVIRMEFGDYWDWDDFNQALAEAGNMIREVKHQVDIVTYMRVTTPMPDGNPDVNIEAAIQNLPKNVGIHVMVGGNALMNRALKILSHSYEYLTGRFLQSRTEGEAYRLIARNRPEIYDPFECIA